MKRLPIPGQGMWKISAGILSVASMSHILILLAVACLESVSNTPPSLGLLLNVVVHPADIQDRDGALHLLRRARRLFPFIERIFADGAYAGRKMAMTVWRTGAWRLQIVKRSDAAGFEVLPKRWIV